MAETLRRLAEELDGTELAEALEAFGFADLFTEANRDAVSALFYRARSRRIDVDVAAGRPAATPGRILADVDDGMQRRPARRWRATWSARHDGAVLDGAWPGRRCNGRPRRFSRRSRCAVELTWVGLHASRGSPHAGGRRALIRPWRVTEVTGVGVVADLVVAGERAAVTWDAVRDGGPVGTGIPDPRRGRGDDRPCRRPCPQPGAVRQAHRVVSSGTHSPCPTRTTRP